jgi:hypothetical protein
VSFGDVILGSGWSSCSPLLAQASRAANLAVRIRIRIRVRVRVRVRASQAEPFGVIQLAAFGIWREVAESLGHSFKAEFAQPVEYRLMQQWLSPQ